MKSLKYGHKLGGFWNQNPVYSSSNLKYYKSIRDLSGELHSKYFGNDEYILSLGQQVSQEIGIVKKIQEISQNLIIEAQRSQVSESLD